MVHTGVHLTYAGLLAHVYNSCDYDLMYQFLNSYYRPDFVLHQELTGSFTAYCPHAISNIMFHTFRQLSEYG